MTNEEIISQINAIADKDIKIPTNIPIEDYTHEAEKLYQWSLEDKDKLIGRGLKVELIDSLPIRIISLRDAESAWQLAKVGQEDLKKEWAEKSKNAYALKKLLLHDFAFAFRDDKEILKKVSAIKEGSGHTDMFQDMNDLALLGKQYNNKLEEIKFDLNLLEKASDYAKTLPPIFATINNKKGNSTTIKKFRDQAYTYLKIAIDEIRKYGQFVFWQNPERKKGYYSEYMRKKNANRINKPKEENKNIAV